MATLTSIDRAEAKIEELRAEVAKLQGELSRALELVATWRGKYENVKDLILDLCTKTNGRHSGCSCCDYGDDEWDDDDLRVSSDGGVKV